MAPSSTGLGPIRNRRRLLIGTRLGRYEVLGKLGTGGMGDVYRARDRELGREVALKVLRQEVAADPDRLARFEQEARTASALTHPNIVTIFEIAEQEGIHFIAMELIEGTTLRELLSGRALSARRTLEVACQAADGLAKAHAAGIVHRDLKPENVMVTDDGVVKILDFGLAKLLTPLTETDPDAPTRSSTYSGVLLGTYSYMSPEQAQGKLLDFRSDQFSWGLILYEMATGRRAFRRGSTVQTLSAIIDEEPEPIAALNPTCPVPLRWIVERCLAKDPAERYASTLDLARELRNVRDHLDQAVASDSWPHPALPARHSRLAWGAAGGLLILVLGLALALERGWLTRHSPPQGLAPNPVVAVLPLADLSKPGEGGYLGAGVAEMLATSLAQAPGVTVIAPSATRGYRDPKGDVARVSRDLGATLVLEGALQRAGDRLRATVSLVDAKSRRVVWSDAVDGHAQDILGLERSLGERVAAALQISLSANERRRLQRPGTADPDALADYAQARSFLERPDVPENLDRAVQLFESALARDPGFGLAHAGLGEAYWERYQATKDPDWTDKATREIVEALRLDPDQAQVRVSLAIVYEGTGRRDAAIDELRQAITLQPRNDDAHRILGGVLQDKGRKDEALAELKQAVALRPNYWRNHSYLGNAYYAMGRYQEAIACFERVTELQPDNAWGFQMLGTAYQTIGKNDLALEQYQKAIRLHPEPRAYSNMGTIHYEAGDYERAAESYERAAELDPSSAATRRNLGDAYGHLGRHGKARECYVVAANLTRKLLEVNPKDARTLAMLGVYEAKLGRFTEALDHARQAVQLNPTQAGVLYRAAVVQCLSGRESEALATLAKALRNGYSPTIVRGDEDLAALRTRPEFRKLMDAGP